MTEMTTEFVASAAEESFADRVSLAPNPQRFCLSPSRTVSAYSMFYLPRLAPRIVHFTRDEIFSASKTL